MCKIELRSEEMKDKSMYTERKFGGGILFTENKKGFTLIELLAVIVILAVIALIATPIILHIIENARFGAAKSSAIGYVEASEKGVIIHLMENRKNKITGDCTVKGNVLTCGETPLTLDVKGSLPSSGTITFDKNGNVNSVTDLLINGYKFSYDGTWTGEKSEGEVVPPKEEGREATTDDFGKYVNYEPNEATWEEGKLEEYGVAETETKTHGTFNIYDYKTSASAKGKNKSSSITCYSSSYQTKYEGWRVLDVSSSGQITLIHGGTPECFYKDSSNNAAATRTLLETASTASSPGTSKAWTKYGNTTLAESVHYLNDTDYNKILENINGNTNYNIKDYLTTSDDGTCYTTSSTQCGKGNDMIDIGSYYWLASPAETNILHYWNPRYQRVDGYYDRSYGVRPVIILKS